MKKIVFPLILIFISRFTYSLDTNVVKFYPLKLGNVWVYHHVYTGLPPTNHYYRDMVDSSIIVNGHTFYRLQHACKFVGGFNQCGPLTYLFYRIDSTTGRIYQYNVSPSCPYMPGYWILDSLQARLGDSIGTCESNSALDKQCCIDTTPENIYGSLRSIRIFEIVDFEFGDERKYAKQIGLYYSDASGQFGSTIDTLIGCVINGVVYGDTTFTLAGINPISSDIPFKFYLSQNYPNPFNPSTKIKFSIPPLSIENGEGEGVRLIIYDILGHELAKLVNEKLQPGTYEVEWNGTNYPSGVYFYKLHTATFSKTNTMVLLK